MATFRYVRAGIALALTVIALLVCLVVIVSAWAVRSSINDGVDTGIATLDGYLDLVSDLIQQVDGGLMDMQNAVNGISQQAQQGPVAPGLTADLAARLQRLSMLVGRLQNSVTTLGRALDRTNRLPGSDAVPVTNRLQPVTDGLARVQSGINDLQAAIAQGDNSRVVALSTSIANAIADTRARLASMQATITETRASLADTQKQVPRWTLLGVLLVILLFAVFGVGQVNLLARTWIRLWQPGNRVRAHPR